MDKMVLSTCSVCTKAPVSFFARTFSPAPAARSSRDNVYRSASMTLLGSPLCTLSIYISLQSSGSFSLSPPHAVLDVVADDEIRSFRSRERAFDSEITDQDESIRSLLRPRPDTHAHIYNGLPLPSFRQVSRFQLLPPPHHC